MLVFAIERCEPAIKYTYIPSLLGFPPTHPGHYRETGWVPCAISSYYATSVELIPLHCKPLISTIMTIDRFASILVFFFPSSVFGTHSKSGFPITYSHGPGLKHCLFKVVFIIYISGINYYSGLNYAFIFHLKMVDVHYQPLAIFKHFLKMLWK